jgi:hypothetical protein
MLPQLQVLVLLFTVGSDAANVTFSPNHEGFT